MLKYAGALALIVHSVLAGTPVYTFEMKGPLYVKFGDYHTMKPWMTKKIEIDGLDEY